MSDDPIAEVTAAAAGPAPVDNGFHRPVLLKAVVDAARGARRAVDGTLGDGGHAEALREAGIELLAIDRDPDAIRIAQARLGDAGIRYLNAPFASEQALAEIHDFEPDFILLDLGVSSRQLDEESRGFTFRPGAPLDMRMTPGEGIRAADVLNTWAEAALTELFAEQADEPRARALARIVIRRRQHEPFLVSDDFVNAIREALGARSGPSEFARLFQALRIAVNGEDEQLDQALPALRDALIPGGRIAVITYHSGEDRRIKNAFRDWAKSCVCPPRQPICTCRGRPLGRLLSKKGITATVPEVAANPRARSAKLRAFETVDGA
jgi:16S rRNA (cytosine1402-N4)-methyltransferase